MATKKIDVSTSTKRPPGVPAKGGNSKDAKDLRDLIQTLSDKNSPETSKDITAFAKQTLKVVGQSQKSESAAFRREATKALIDFKSFVEKTDKLNETRRSKLLNDIDSVTLDAKSAVFMMMSIAKEQSKTIKMTAEKEAAVERLKAKQSAATLLEDAKNKSKVLADESKQKSKLISEEQNAKLKAQKEDFRLKSKAVSEEQSLKYKVMKEEALKKIKADKEAVKLSLTTGKDAIKAERIALHAKYDQVRQDLIAEKAKNKLEIEQEKVKLKQQRTDTAIKLRQIKVDLKDRQDAKNLKQDTDIKNRKADLLQRNSDRIQKIRVMSDEHKTRMKKIEEDAKGDAIIKKAKLKSEVDEINDKHKRIRDKHEKNADSLSSKVKEGIYDANPLIHAAVQIGSGIVGMVQKRSGEKRKQKALNRLQHNPNTNTPNPTPNPNPAPPTNGPGPNPPPASGGGFFDSIISMLPSITGIVSGIATFFSSVASMALKLGKFVLSGAKFLPMIGAVVAVVTTVFDFIEGFNNASKLFGEKVEDDSYIKRIFSGFVNVFASIIGIFDTVAGWFGFDTDLKGMYEKAQVKLFGVMSGAVDIVVNTVSSIFESIVKVVRSMAGGIAAILDYIPGGGDAAKALKAFSMAGNKGTLNPNASPSSSSIISDKQNTVNDLQDEVDLKKSKGSVQVISDSSIKTQSTTITPSPLSTRNTDPNAPAYLIRR